ncbi:helix-turn-helix domain-containing protein [Bacillus solitudinis]|uniref:helix-turn-helix domain-containing protein n=1 Tax=Bacillus solitudinis TaxID=2014074 RepID=UPI000C23E7EA|nr:helix-turn-helix domain-containing protein [Bacillus solitudinis]
MKKTLSYIGNQIRHIRKERNWTLGELAKKSGLTLNYLAHIERGKVKVSVAKLEAVIVALGTTWHNILPPDYEEEHKLKKEVITQVKDLEKEENFRLFMALIREMKEQAGEDGDYDNKVQ